MGLLGQHPEAGRQRWPFELFYWDYAIGVFLLGILFAFTLVSPG
jgi:glucose uptake protein